MKRLAWITDAHLNFVTPEAIDGLCRDVVDADADALLLGGDIGEAPSIEAYLSAIEERVGRPIYFVLGNHDFYFGSIAAVRDVVGSLARRSRWLEWLCAGGIVELTPRTGLVGHGGWGDGRLGAGQATRVSLNDTRLISELTDLEPFELFSRLEAYGDQAAAHVRALLPVALGRYEHVVFLTHVPPFAEACWHEGGISGDEWLPFFVCGAVGDALREAAGRHPDRRITVLCGHTHSAGEVAIRPNLRVLTGAARYGAPALQETLVVD